MRQGEERAFLGCYVRSLDMSIRLQRCVYYLFIYLFISYILILASYCIIHQLKVLGKKKNLI